MNRLTKLMMAFEEKNYNTLWLRNKGLPHQGDDGLLDSPYTKSDLVYICISTTARAISQVPLEVRIENKQGDVEIVGTDDKWQKLINRPNPLMDIYSFIESIITCILLDGNAFIIPYPYDYKEVPLSLYVLSDRFIEPRKDSKSNQLIGWNYNPSGLKGSNTIPLEVDAVSHIWLHNPYDPVMGLSPLKAGKMSITSDYRAARFNQLFFSQGANIGGVVSTEGKLTQKQYDRFKTQLSEKHAGIEQAHKMMILDGGLKYSQTALTHRDMSFPELRKLDKERILQIFGMKKAVISVTDDLNYATAKEQKKSWWQDTNLPLMKLILSALNFTFFEYRNDNRYLAFDEDSITALQEDLKDKIETAKNLFAMGYTSNEINQKLELGFDETEWRDKAYVAMGFTEVNGEEEEEPETPEANPIEPIEEPETPEVPTPAEEIINLSKEISEDQKIKIWQKVAQRTEKLELDFEGKIKKAFYKMRVDILKWLYSQKPKSIEKQDEFAFTLTRPIKEIGKITNRPLKQLKKEANRLYELLLLDGIQTLASEIGVAADLEILATPEAQVYLKEKVIQLVGPDGIKRTIDKQLNNEITKGIKNKETIEKIAKRIKGRFNSAANRAKTIARTESFSALNFGRSEMAKRSDFTKKVWITSLDERVRFTHLGAHGEKIDIGESWSIGGSTLSFPGDPNGEAGEVINCRCIEIVDLKSFEDDSKQDSFKKEKYKKEKEKLRKKHDFKMLLSSLNSISDGLNKVLNTQENKNLNQNSDYIAMAENISKGLVELKNKVKE